MQILTDTKGIDFGPYVHNVVATVRKNWYGVIPASALPPELKRGKVVLEFSILKNGQITGLRYFSASGDVALDRAAYAGVAGSNPFPPLPSQFTGDNLRLRFKFLYNPGPEDFEAVRLSEILVPVDQLAASLDAVQARAKADDLLADIRAGKGFETVAGKNPDLGWFERGLLSAQIENVVFGMKVGDISDVIRTKQGFVILKVTDRHGRTKPAPAVPVGAQQNSPASFGP